MVVDKSGVDIVTEAPTSYKHAEQYPCWVESMEKEVTTMENMGCFEIIPLSEVPQHSQVIPVRFVFRVKRDIQGEHFEHKSRLVARGDMEVEEPEENNYAPTGNISVARTLLSLAARSSMHIWSFDVSSAFLTAPTSEERPPIIRPPPNRPRFINGVEVVYICKRAIYGLRGSPLRFQQHLRGVLKRMGLEQSKWEPCLFIAQLGTGKFIACFAHVDDILVATPSQAISASLKSAIQAEFNITIQDPVVSFLNIRLFQSNGLMYMDQSHMIKDILRRSGMDKATPLNTIMEVGVLKEPSAPLNPEAAAKYRQIVGAILYLQCTRPDLAAATSILCQFAQNPHLIHQRALEHVLRFLVGSKEHRLVLGRDEHSTLVAMADSDWGGDFASNSGSGRSRTGFVVHLHGPIAWRSTLQKTVATSTAEAELYALTEATQEMIFLNGVLKDDFGKDIGIPRLYGDNQSAIDMANKGKFTRSSRHINIKHRFLHNMVEEKSLVVTKIPGVSNMADILTKILPAPRTKTLTSSIMTWSGDECQVSQ